MYILFLLGFCIRHNKVHRSEFIFIYSINEYSRKVKEQKCPFRLTEFLLFSHKKFPGSSSYSSHTYSYSYSQTQTHTIITADNKIIQCLLFTLCEAHRCIDINANLIILTMKCEIPLYRWNI